jgi:hypothetical protein
MGKAGSNPAFDVTYRGSGLAKAVASRVPVLPLGSAGVDVIETEIACSPACLLDCWSAAMRLGTAVAKMSVTSVKAPTALRFGVGWSKSRGRNAVAERSSERQRHLLFPANPYTIRGEDRCYFVSSTRGRGFESRPASHAPVAQWPERFPARRGHLRAGVSAIARSRIVSLLPVVKRAVTSGSQC